MKKQWCLFLHAWLGCSKRNMEIVKVIYLNGSFYEWHCKICGENWALIMHDAPEEFEKHNTNEKWRIIEEQLKQRKSSCA